MRDQIPLTTSETSFNTNFKQRVTDGAHLGRVMKSNDSVYHVNSYDIETPQTFLI